MSELTNYIKERITYYEELKKVSVPGSTTSISYMYLLTELQAVLSKLEEIEKEKCAKFLEEYEKRFPPSDITSSIVYHEPITKEDIISKS